MNTESLNTNIVDTVLFCNDYFETVDSGDGQTSDYECDRGYPYVVMKVPSDCDVSGEEPLSCP